MAKLIYTSLILCCIAPFTGCAPSFKSQTDHVIHLSDSIDRYTDTLIAHYGTRLDTLLTQNANALKVSLNTLAHDADSIKCGPAQAILQPYISDCRNLYLLSLNPNLNADAFARTLTSLSASRSRLHALINRQSPKH